MKKNNTIKVVLITTIVLLVLSWIFKAAYFQGEFVDQGRVQMGLFDLFNYPLTALSYFGYIALYLIAVGGFYGILYKIPAYRNLLDKISGAFKNKGMLFLSIVVVLFALLVSICGLQIGLALVIPFVVSIILLIGYDKNVAALVTVGSMAVGLAGSTYANANLNVLTSSLNLDINYQIWVRVVILLVGIILVIFNTFMYTKRNMKVVKAEKTTVKKAEVEEVKVATKVEPEKKSKSETVKKNSSKNSATKKSTKSTSSNSKKSSSKSRKSVNKAALKDEDIIVVKENMGVNKECLVPNAVGSVHKVWPFVTLFILLFIVFVLAFIPWSTVFKIDLFDKMLKGFTEFELFGFPIFGKIFGTVNSFGNWMITDMFLPMALVILILAFIYRLSFDDIIDGFMAGAKKALRPAIVAMLVYTILVLVTYHPFQLVLYKAIIGKKFNVVKEVLTAILATIFNVDPSYTFQSVLPYLVSVVTDTKLYGLVGIIYQSMYGFTTLFAPSSLILMTTLSFLKVSYGSWLKTIWKLLLELFIILLIIFIILAVI